MRICKEIGIAVSKGQSTIAILSIAKEVIENLLK